MKTKSLTPLAITFAMGGIWDTIAGLIYIFAIGTERVIDILPITFYFRQEAVCDSGMYFCLIPANAPDINSI